MCFLWYAILRASWGVLRVATRGRRPHRRYFLMSSNKLLSSWESLDVTSLGILTSRAENGRQVDQFRPTPFPMCKTNHPVISLDSMNVSFPSLTYRIPEDRDHFTDYPLSAARDSTKPSSSLIRNQQRRLLCLSLVSLPLSARSRIN